MKTWQAIVLTIALILLLSAIDNGILTASFVGLSSLWMAIDSSKIQLKKYKTGMAGPPVMVFIAGVLFWAIAFPWYLSVRYRIKHGSIVLQETSTPAGK